MTELWAVSVHLFKRSTLRDPEVAEGSVQRDMNVAVCNRLGPIKGSSYTRVRRQSPENVAQTSA